MISGKLVQAINLADKYSYIKKVGVFGSFARDEETDESDVNIIIEYFDHCDDFLDDVDNFMEELENAIPGMKIDFVTLNGLTKSKNPIIRDSILKDVVWIYVTG